MATELRRFRIKWYVYGVVELHAENVDAAHRVVRRTSLGTLLGSGDSDCELEIYDITDNWDSDAEFSELEFRGLTPRVRLTQEDSMVDLFGELE